MARCDLWPRVEPLLSRVERPARYLNHEWGCAAPVAEGDFAFCMIYPDTYELGQANQAVRILVNAVNARRTAWPPSAPSCRRRRIWPTSMRDEGLPLFSHRELPPPWPTSTWWASRCPTSWPPPTCWRRSTSPASRCALPTSAPRATRIVLAGGPCAYNPEPYAPFFRRHLQRRGGRGGRCPRRWRSSAALRAEPARPAPGILRERSRDAPGGAYVPSALPLAQRSPRPRRPAAWSGAPGRRPAACA